MFSESQIIFLKHTFNNLFHHRRSNIVWLRLHPFKYTLIPAYEKIEDSFEIKESKEMTELVFKNLNLEVVLKEILDKKIRKVSESLIGVRYEVSWDNKIFFEDELIIAKEEG